MKDFLGTLLGPKQHQDGVGDKGDHKVLVGYLLNHCTMLWRWRYEKLHSHSSLLNEAARCYCLRLSNYYDGRACVYDGKDLSKGPLLRYV